MLGTEMKRTFCAEQNIFPSKLLTAFEIKEQKISERYRIPTPCLHFVTWL